MEVLFIIIIIFFLYFKSIDICMPLSIKPKVFCQGSALCDELENDGQTLELALIDKNIFPGYLR